MSEIVNLWEDYVYLTPEERKSFFESQKIHFIFSEDYYSIFYRPEVLSTISELVGSDISSIIDKYIFENYKQEKALAKKA